MADDSASVLALTPEHDLLVACARLHLDPVSTGRLRARLGGPLNFDGLLHAGRAHGVMPLLGRHLLTESGDAVPDAVRERLRLELREIGRRNVVATGELVRILGRLREARILAVPFKGPVAALVAYGNLGTREYYDLDVLIHRRDLDRAAAVLLESGYRMLDDPAASHRAVVRRAGYSHAFVHQTSGTIVELHWRFVPAWFQLSLTLDSFADRLVTMPLAGVDVRVLDLEDTLLILCVHGTKHLWARLEWICLVAELVRRHPALDWAALTSRASAVGARRIVRLALQLARDVLDAPYPPEAARALGADPAVPRLAGEVSADLFSSSPATARPWTSALIHIRSRERARDRVRQAIGLALEPTIGDWMALALPPRLTWVYYLTRPARLTWRYGVLLGGGLVARTLLSQRLRDRLTLKQGCQNGNAATEHGTETDRVRPPARPPSSEISGR